MTGGCVGWVDSHHHVWDLVAGPPHAWLDEPDLAGIRRSFALDELVPLAAAAGVSRTVLVQVLGELAETEAFLALAAASPLVAGVVGWVDLTDPGVADVLGALRERPGNLVGVRHLVQGEPDPEWLSRPDVRRGLKAVGAAGLAYDLLTKPVQLPAAIATARALPEMTFVLDHLSKPPIAAGKLEPWARLVRELAAEPNVSCKLSGMVTEADRAGWTVEQLRPYAATVLEAFGPARVMFGSDWPVCLLAASYAEVVDAAEALSAGLSEAERADVFAGTAERAYGLRPTRA